MQCVAVRNANTRTSGSAVSMLGREPVFSRKRSQIASLTRSVANSRLLSGDLIAVMSTRSVWAGANQRSQGCSSASAKTSCSLRYGLSAIFSSTRLAIRK
ncbi:MAG: hypothetical protein GAK41_00486 [Burkholderia gladioli]|nr:MAG: hypothetical protein GAK41_00486 [Burkholderia gladioli]